MGHIQIWPVRLEGTDETVDRLRTLLSDDEVRRADSFKFVHLRRAFIMTRGLLRSLLARYLGTAPETIRFTTGPNGKPALHDAHDLRFNLAHSGDLVVFAFARSIEIGVDVELVKEFSDYSSIAERYFSREEFHDLLALPAETRQGAFFLCWTRKEAYIKATGEGLAASLDAFRVTLNPSEPARFVSLSGKTAANWKLHNLVLGPNYAGALAYEGPAHELYLSKILQPWDLLGK